METSLGLKETRQGETILLRIPRHDSDFQRRLLERIPIMETVVRATRNRRNARDSPMEFARGDDRSRGENRRRDRRQAGPTKERRYSPHIRIPSGIPLDNSWRRNHALPRSSWSAARRRFGILKNVSLHTAERPDRDFISSRFLDSMKD